MTTRRTAPSNEVHLVGRVSGGPTARELPSGDQVVQLRLVVPRPRRRGADGTGRTQVDTLDVACWTARTRGAALRLSDGQGAEVTGRLRRRFFAAHGARASRYEVEATSLRRVELDEPG